MISTDGATLIATLIPIGLVALAFERHVKRPRPKNRWRIGFELARVAVITFSVLFSMFALYFCVQAVSADEPLVGASAWFVGASSGALFWVIAYGIGAQVIERLFESLNHDE